MTESPDNESKLAMKRWKEKSNVKKKKMKKVVSLISPQKPRQGRWPLRFGFRRLSSTATRFYATSLLPSSDLSGNSEKVFTSQECIILDKTPCALWKSWRPTAPPIEQKHKYHTVIIYFHFFEVITWLFSSSLKYDKFDKHNY